MLRRLAVLCLAAALLAVSIVVAKAVSPVDELVRSERAFSATSVDKGMRDAFVEFLADEAVLFRPLPVDGKKLWTSRAAVPGTLIWEPSFAQVAASGDFGYTTGPWEFRPPAADSAGGVAHGHFISIWRRSAPDAPWRVVVDIGIQHDKPERGLGSGLRDAAALPARKTPKDSDADIAALDRQLSERTFVKGIGSAVAEVAASDFILDRDGFQPTLGVEPARAAFDSLKGGLRFDGRGSGIARSQDLGFTYGITRWFGRGAEAPGDSGVYMHVWRREGAKNWKLALAVENPL